MKNKRKPSRAYTLLRGDIDFMLDRLKENLEYHTYLAAEDAYSNADRCADLGVVRHALLEVVKYTDPGEVQDRGARYTKSRG